jgi:arabinose-5-phosphate isomerase
MTMTTNGVDGRLRPPASSQNISPRPDEKLFAIGRLILTRSADCVKALEETLDDTFGTVIDLITTCPTMIVVAGVGKSYIVSQKIASTLSSTGSPATALCAFNALHGDVGRVRAQDVVFLLSASGETTEVIELVRHCKSLGTKTVAMTCRPFSTLAQYCDLVLTISVPTGNTVYDLLPTASTTTMMALGDAIAMEVASRKGLDHQEIALMHPAGSIGAVASQRSKTTGKTDKESGSL